MYDSERKTGSVEDVLAALRAAAEPTRLRILSLCAGGELTVSELVRILGQSQPRVSRHLKLLVDAGLLDRVREGSWVFHRLAHDDPGGAMARHLIAFLPDGGGAAPLDADRLAEVKRERAGAAAAYFRRNAARWDKVRSLYADEKEVETVLRRLLPRRGARDLLDIGTGTGRMLEVFAPQVGHVHGIDLSPEMLAVARTNLERAGIANSQVRKADMYRLPFASESFDAATIHQVLHFADDPGKAITEAGRVLRPSGRLLVADFAPHDLEFLRDEHEHRRLGFSDSEVAAWFKNAHLKVKEIVRLPGDPLTVTVWMGAKPRRRAAGADRRPPGKN